MSERIKTVKSKKILILPVVLAAVAAAALLTVVAALIALHFRTGAIRDDYTAILGSGKYGTPVAAEGVRVIRQDVSCGYAVIEMFSTWSGHSVTEKSLYEEYGRVVTSTGRGFTNEMNKRFPEYKTEMHKYLKNTELIDLAYEQLSEGVPVPFEWAALNGEEWTLHYSLIVGMDIPNDKITVANPYGYTEELSVEDFLNRTSFDAYGNMPFFLKLGFAFGIFEKNTVFSVERIH